MKLTAKDIMTADVVTVSPETRVEQAAAELVRHRITGLPVLDASGNVVGMIGDIDVIGKSGRNVDDIMSTQVITISPDTELDEISYILKHLHRLPVVQAGKLVGVVSRSDLLKRIAQRWTCAVCGAQDYGAAAPDHCPECGAPAQQFNLVEEPPMMYRDM
jgi:CBS-domain-containing membrane protein